MQSLEHVPERSRQHIVENHKLKHNSQPDFISDDKSESSIGNDSEISNSDEEESKDKVEKTTKGIKLGKLV